MPMFTDLFFTRNSAGYFNAMYWHCLSQCVLKGNVIIHNQLVCFPVECRTCHMKIIFGKVRQTRNNRSFSRHRKHIAQRNHCTKKLTFRLTCFVFNSNHIYRWHIQYTYGIDQVTEETKVCTDIVRPGIQHLNHGIRRQTNISPPTTK